VAVEFVDCARHARWRFKCDCGNDKLIVANSVIVGLTKSCGCLKREILIGRNYRHGRRRTPEYKAWQDMNARCGNPKNKSFSDYGGRGITVCERWRNSFQAFFDDVGPRPSDEHSIDRIQNGGDYEPSNVRWANRSQQMKNRRPRRIPLPRMTNGQFGKAV